MSRPLGPVVALQERLCSLLQSMGPEDVTYQEGLGAAPLARFVAEQLGAKKVEKALQEMLWRVKKHYGDGTPMQARAVVLRFLCLFALLRLTVVLVWVVVRDVLVQLISASAASRCGDALHRAACSTRHNALDLMRADELRMGMSDTLCS